MDNFETAKLMQSFGCHVENSFDFWLLFDGHRCLEDLAQACCVAFDGDEYIFVGDIYGDYLEDVLLVERMHRLKLILQRLLHLPVLLELFQRNSIHITSRLYRFLDAISPFKNLAIEYRITQLILIIAEAGAHLQPLLVVFQYFGDNRTIKYVR